MSGERGRPFEPGNQYGRGRPKGSKNKRSTLAQETLEQYAEPLVKKGIAKALEGDTSMIKYCLDWLLRGRGERAARLKIRKLENVQDVERVQQTLMEQVIARKISLSYGEKLYAMLADHRANIESREGETRLAELEKIARERQAKNRRR